MDAGISALPLSYGGFHSAGGIRTRASPMRMVTDFLRLASFTRRATRTSECKPDVIPKITGLLRLASSFEPCTNVHAPAPVRK